MISAKPVLTLSEEFRKTDWEVLWLGFVVSAEPVEARFGQLQDRWQFSENFLGARKATLGTLIVELTSR